MAGPKPSDRRNDEAPRYSAQDARGGEIILKKRRNRVIFAAGLVALVLAALVLTPFLVGR